MYKSSLINMFTSKVSAVFYCVLAALVSASLGLEYPEVLSPLGKVRGYYRTTDGGRNISAFEGVPYAKPPVGELRFKVSKFMCFIFV